MDVVALIVTLIFLLCDTTFPHRQFARVPFLVNETILWMKKCQNVGGTCKSFASCASNFPQIGNCTKNGGLLEIPNCDYWADIIFDPKEYGIFGCYRKFVMVNYKSRCAATELKTNCTAFSACCQKAAAGNCTRYFSGELEQPICEAMGKSFTYASAPCECITDSSEVVFRSNVIERVTEITDGEISTIASTRITNGPSTITKKTPTSKGSIPTTTSPIGSSSGIPKAVIPNGNRNTTSDASRDGAEWVVCAVAVAIADWRQA